MSALDDIIARDAGGAQPSALDAIISRDAGGAPQGAVPNAPTAAATLQNQGSQQAGKGPVPGGFLMGLGDAVKGGVQGIVHGVSYVADKVAPDSQFAKDFHSGAQQVDQAIHDQNQAYEAQRAASGDAGFDPGRLAGNVVGAIPASLVNPELGAGGLLARTGVGALQGAAGSLVMPVNDTSQGYGQQKLSDVLVGGGLGAAAPAIGAAARAAGRNVAGVVQPVLNPGQYVGQGLARTFSPTDASAIADRIRTAPTFVPGSAPTTAQVGATPVLVQTEKALANTSPDFKGALTQLQNNNNAARWGVLNDVGQTPQRLQQFQDARAAAVQPLYNAANQQTTNVGNAFINFAQRPAVMQAMQQADTLARNEGVQLKWPTPQDRAINGQALDYTQRALSDMIDSAQRAGNNQQMRALTDARDYLNGWTQRYIPAQRQAAAVYRNMSVPINTMQAGQDIANSIGTRAMDSSGLPNITLPAYRSAMVKAVDGQKFGIEPGALRQLQGVGQDLQRASISNSLPASGSDTAYNLAANGWLARNLYGPGFEGASTAGKTTAALAAALSGHPIAGAGVFAGGNRIGQAVGQRLQVQLGHLLLNPDALLPHLDAHAATALGNPPPNALVQGLLNHGRPALVNGATAALVNSP